MLLVWRVVISRTRFWWQHWAFRWQLSNLWIWLRVRYGGAPLSVLPELPPLQTEQTERLERYFQVKAEFRLAGEPLTARDISLRKNSHYVGDLLRALHPHFTRPPFTRLFGDVTWVPDSPTFVKSRPIGNHNQNAVLLPLDARRHMCFPDDPYPFEQKQSKVMWRGASHQEHRKIFLARNCGLSFCDVGDPGLAKAHEWHKPWLSVYAQMQFKYIVSVEGNDVATNLKWIMHSNALCLMRKPRYETWFLESRLIPGVHYAELADDFSNLEEVFLHYERHPDEALAIIREAQRYVHPFLNAASERLLTQHVCKAYFSAALAPYGGSVGSVARSPNR